MDGVLERVRSAGFIVKLTDDGRLLVGGELTDTQADFVREHRDEILRPSQHWGAKQTPQPLEIFTTIETLFSQKFMRPGEVAGLIGRKLGQALSRPNEVPDRQPQRKVPLTLSSYLLDAISLPLEWSETVDLRQ